MAKRDKVPSGKDETLVSRKKVSLKQTLVAAAMEKRRSLTAADIVSERTAGTVGFSTLVSRGGGFLGRVVVTDSDPTDRYYEYDNNASDPFHYTDTDPRDPVGYPRDIILAD